MLGLSNHDGWGSIYFLLLWGPTNSKADCGGSTMGLVEPKTACGMLVGQIKDRGYESPCIHIHDSSWCPNFDLR